MSCIITQFLNLERLYDKTEPIDFWYNYPNCSITFSSKLHVGVYLISIQCGEYSYQVSNSSDFVNILDYQVCRYSISPYTWSRWMIPNQRLNYALSNLIGIEETLRSIISSNGSLNITLSGDYLDLSVSGFLLTNESNLINPVNSTLRNLESSSDFSLSTNNESLILSSNELIKRHNSNSEMSNLAYNRNLKSLAVKTPLLIEDLHHTLTITGDNLVHNKSGLSNLVTEDNEILGFNASEDFVLETVGNDLYLTAPSFARINASNLCFGNNLKNLMVNSSSNIGLTIDDSIIELSGNFVINNSSNLLNNNEIKSFTVNTNDFNLVSTTTELTLSANKLIKKSISNMVNQTDNTVKNLNVEYPLISSILNTSYTLSIPDALIKSTSNLLIDNTVRNLTTSGGLTVTTSNDNINLSTNGLVFQSNSNIAINNQLSKLLPLWPLKPEFWWETNEFKIVGPTILTNEGLNYGFISNLVSRDSNNELLQILRDIRVSDDFTITADNTANSITISTGQLVKKTRNNGTASNLVDGQYMKSLNVQPPLVNTIYGLSHNITAPTVLTNDAPITSSIVSNLISKYQGSTKTTLKNLTVSGGIALTTTDDTILLKSKPITASSCMKILESENTLEILPPFEYRDIIFTNSFSTVGNYIYELYDNETWEYTINNNSNYHVYYIERNTYSGTLLKLNFYNLNKVFKPFQFTSSILNVNVNNNTLSFTFSSAIQNHILKLKVVSTYRQDVYIEGIYEVYDDL